MKVHEKQRCLEDLVVYLRDQEDNFSYIVTNRVKRECIGFVSNVEFLKNVCRSIQLEYHSSHAEEAKKLVQRLQKYVESNLSMFIDGVEQEIEIEAVKSEIRELFRKIRLVIVEPDSNFDKVPVVKNLEPVSIMVVESPKEAKKWKEKGAKERKRSVEKERNEDISTERKAVISTERKRSIRKKRPTETEIKKVISTERKKSIETEIQEVISTERKKSIRKKRPLQTERKEKSMETEIIEVISTERKKSIRKTRPPQTERKEISIEKERKEVISTEKKEVISTERKKSIRKTRTLQTERKERLIEKDRKQVIPTEIKRSLEKEPSLGTERKERLIEKTLPTRLVSKDREGKIDEMIRIMSLESGSSNFDFEAVRKRLYHCTEREFLTDLDLVRSSTHSSPRYIRKISHSLSDTDFKSLKYVVQQLQKGQSWSFFQQPLQAESSEVIILDQSPLGDISSKISRRCYSTLSDFVTDVKQMVENYITYQKKMLSVENFSSCYQFVSLFHDLMLEKFPDSGFSFQIYVWNNFTPNSINICSLDHECSLKFTKIINEITETLEVSVGRKNIGGRMNNVTQQGKDRMHSEFFYPNHASRNNSAITPDPELSSDQRFELGKYGVPNEHLESHKKLIRDSENFIRRNLFPLWYSVLSQGSNVFIHGIGCKIDILMEFFGKLKNTLSKQRQDENSFLIISGFEPGVDIEVVVEKICDVFHIKWFSENKLKELTLETKIGLIEAYLGFKNLKQKEFLGREGCGLDEVEDPGKAQLFLLVYNFERFSKQDLILWRKLLSMDYVRVIVCVDNLFADRSWTMNDWGLFNFRIYEASTHREYERIPIIPRKRKRSGYSGGANFDDYINAVASLPPNLNTFMKAFILESNKYPKGARISEIQEFCLAKKIWYHKGCDQTAIYVNLKNLVVNGLILRNELNLYRINANQKLQNRLISHYKGNE